MTEVDECRKALRKTRDVSWRLRMEEINKILGGFGVEAIRGEWKNGYWCDIVATYVNRGDTYSTTVLHVRGESQFDDRGRFIVSSWGDFVERNGERYGIM